MPKTNKVARRLHAAIEAANVPVPGTDGEGTARVRLRVGEQSLSVVVSMLNLNQVPGRPGRRTLMLSVARTNGSAATRKDGEALARLLGTPARIWLSGPRVCLRAA